jgi:formylglycine-generating enzyme required for sulfatase activity
VRKHEAVLSRSASLRASSGLLLAAPLFLAHSQVADARKASGCPAGMAFVMGRYCIDRYEASLEELAPDGTCTGTHSPFHSPAGSRTRARSRKGVTPQAYISKNEAGLACARAGKRLCTDEEWLTACRGRQPTQYPYGDEHHAGYCNDQGVSPLRLLFGASDDAQTFGFDRMNDSRLNQVPGSLAKTGSFPHCRNAFGVYDMVGNLHEWTANKDGTFRGGYYLDNHINGDGCSYQTTQHSPDYHDYSIGFRCCATPSGQPAKRTAVLSKE